MIQLLLAVSLPCHAAFIKPPSRHVQVADAIQLHINSTKLAKDISEVKLYLQAVIDLHSPPPVHKMAAEVLLHGLKYTDSVSEVLEVLLARDVYTDISPMDHLSAGHTSVAMERLTENLSPKPYNWKLWDNLVEAGSPFVKELADGTAFDGRKK